MRYSAFEDIITPIRMGRYLTACKGNSRKAMTLYRKNLQLSQELFTVISCFEVALRNAIDRHYISTLGNDWLRNAAAAGGIFANNYTHMTAKMINEEITRLNQHYNMILKLFQWMQIDEASLLYGLDHISNICEQIDAL